MAFKIPRRSLVTTAQLRDFVKTWRDPDKKRLATKKRVVLVALDAYDRSTLSKTLEASALAAIIKAACSQFRPVWIIGSDLLMRTACRFQEGRDAIRRILKTGSAAERFQVVCLITSDLPKAFAKEIISLALHDKGSRVREQAAQRCGHLKRNDLLPEMESRLRVEVNGEVKECLQFMIAMLRDGYQLKYKDGEPRLWVRGPQGYSSPALTQKQIDDGELPELIARIKRGTFPFR